MCVCVYSYVSIRVHPGVDLRFCEGVVGGPCDWVYVSGSGTEESAWESYLEGDIVGPKEKVS